MKSQPVVGGVFAVEYKLGAGGFGEVYVGWNTQTGVDVAIKMEPYKSDNLVLKMEASMYKSLANSASVPMCHWHGIDMFNNAIYNVLVLELMGPSLSSLLRICGGNFNQETVLSLAPQIISCLQHLHDAGLVHQDVKPSNFVLGIRDRVQRVFVIDFGFTKSFKRFNAITESDEHIPYGQVHGHAGTIEYQSVNTHLGKVQSRRDDLEAVAYMLIKFQQGRLPWDLLAGDGDDAIAALLIAKLMLPDELCRDLLDEIAVFLRYCRGLRFDECPDYDYLKGLFNLGKHGYQEKPVFQWEETHEFSDFKCTGILPLLPSSFGDESEDFCVSTIEEIQTAPISAAAYLSNREAQKSALVQSWPPYASPWKHCENPSAPLLGCIPSNARGYSHSKWSELIQDMAEWFYENHEDLLTTGAEKRRQSKMLWDCMREYFKSLSGAS